MLEITSSSRQGIYLIFIFLMVGFGTFLFEMSMFEILLVVGISGIVLKLTDIEEAIRK